MSHRINKDLTSEEIKYYYSLLSDEITTYDCGSLCKGDNNGEPYCCTTRHAVPLLYKGEFEYLQSVGNLWSIWVPKSKDEKELLEEASRDQLFCECKGVAHCVRDERSISCRTFPLEPYVDRRGVFVGLTFLRDFTEKDAETGKVKCPLTRRKNDIQQGFIDSHFLFWEKIMLRRAEEYEIYQDTSKRLRRERKRTGRAFHVLFPSHFRESKTVREYMY